MLIVIIRSDFSESEAQSFSDLIVLYNFKQACLAAFNCLIKNLVVLFTGLYRSSELTKKNLAESGQ